MSASAVLDRLDESNTGGIIQRSFSADEEFTYEKFDQMKVGESSSHLHIES